MSYNFDQEHGNKERRKTKNNHLLWRPLDNLNIGVVAMMILLALLQIFSRPDYILVMIMLGLVLYLLVQSNRFFEKQVNIKSNYRWHISYQIILIIFIIQSFFLFTPNDTFISFNEQLNNIDTFLFGRTPSLYLEQLLNPITVDLFYLIYFSFYFAPLILVFRLYSRQRKESLKLTYLALSLTLYLVMIGYLVLPATGPAQLTNANFNHQVLGFYLTGIVPGLQTLIEPTQFNAFPSIHAAGSLTLLILSYKFDRHFYWRFLPLAVLIQFSVIYLRYSFGISLLAGYTIGLLAYIISSGLFNSQKLKLTIVDDKTDSF